MLESEAMKVIRVIRDRNYEQTKSMNYDEYKKHIAQKASIAREMIKGLDTKKV